jgi:hypothetical protein
LQRRLRDELAVGRVLGEGVHAVGGHFSE